MKEKFTRVCSAILLVLLCSCAYDQADKIQYVTPSQELLDSYPTISELVEQGADVNYEASTATIYVYSDVKWTVASETTWIVAKTVRGYKYTDLEIEVTENFYEYPRSGTIVITEDETGATHTITVRQVKSEDPLTFDFGNPLIDEAKYAADPTTIEWGAISGVSQYMVKLSKDNTFADDQIVATKVVTASDVDEYLTCSLSEVEYKAGNTISIEDNRDGSFFDMDLYLGSTYVRVDVYMEFDMDADGYNDDWFQEGSNVVAKNAPFAGGSGTKSDPFLVSTAEQFSNIKSVINPNTVGTYTTAHPYVGYFRQTQDIDFNYTSSPIGVLEGTAYLLTDYVFHGVYDGGKHTTGTTPFEDKSAENYKLSNYKDVVNAQSAPFPHIGYGGVVMNVDVENIELYGANGVAAISSWSGGTVKYCNALSGSISTASTNYAAGVVCQMYNGVIEDCTNNINITGGYTAIGGVIARICAANYATTSDEICTILVKDCKNYGNLTIPSTTTNTTFCGGVVGTSVAVDGLNGNYLSDPTYGRDLINLRGCINYGGITVEDGYAKACPTGGVIGGLESIGGYLYECGNEGTIYGGSSTGGSAIGGVNGRTPKYSTDGIEAWDLCAGFRSRYERCYNTGSVTSYGKTAAAGGILARSEKSNLEFFDCYNSGAISQLYASSTQVSSGSTSISQTLVAGGILGYISNFNTAARSILMQNCYNYGALETTQKVDGNYTAGGIWGIMNSATTTNVHIMMEGCYSLDKDETLTGGSYYAQDNRMQWYQYAKSGSSLRFFYVDESYTTHQTYADTSYTDACYSYVAAGEATDPVSYDYSTGAAGWYKNEAYSNHSEAEMTSGTAFTGWDTEVWDFSAGSYPTLKWTK